MFEGRNKLCEVIKKLLNFLIFLLIKGKGLLWSQNFLEVGRGLLKIEKIFLTLVEAF